MPRYIIEIIYRSGEEWQEVSNPLSLGDALRRFEVLEREGYSQIRLTFNKKGK